MATREERVERAERNYKKFTPKQKRKYFGGTITKERRGLSHEATAIKDRIEQEKAVGITRGGK